MTDDSTIRYTSTNGVARITLDRPAVSNAVDLSTAQALARAVDDAASDSDVRVVVLDAEGARFCAGGDVESMAASADQAAYLYDLATSLDGALQGLLALDKPVVAAVQGVAAGAGLAMVLAADVVLSARSARYLSAYAGVGLTPDCGLSFLLPRCVGEHRALELALVGRVLDAGEAHAWGIVTTVISDEALDREAAALAARLAAGPAFALGQAKRLIRANWRQTRAESGEAEARTIARAVVTPEATELISKFLGRPRN